MTLPFPGFATDLLPMAIGLAAVSEGSSLITENIFDGRFMFVNEMVRLGADIRTDGHHAVVRGRERLSGAPVRATDIRAGAGLVIAGPVRRRRDRGGRRAPHRPRLPGLRQPTWPAWASRWNGPMCPSRRSTSETSQGGTVADQAAGLLELLGEDQDRDPAVEPDGLGGPDPASASSRRISSASSGSSHDRGRAEQAVVVGLGEDRRGRTARGAGRRRVPPTAGRAARRSRRGTPTRATAISGPIRYQPSLVAMSTVWHRRSFVLPRKCPDRGAELPLSRPG